MKRKSHRGAGGRWGNGPRGPHRFAGRGSQERATFRESKFSRGFSRLWGNGPSGLYRSRSGLILGVCKGLANYFDLSLTWVRVIAVLALIFTGFWPVGMIYLVAALIMKPEPVITPADDTEEEFYSSYASSRTMAVNRLKNTYQSLERRLQRLEHTVTSREFNWQRKV